MNHLTNEEVFSITAKNFSDIDFANAIIAANNAKVLKDLKPDMQDVYTSDQVAAIIAALMQGLDSFKAEIIESLKEFAHDKYMSALKKCEQDACLGWAHKVKNGKYGDAEHMAHAEANKDFGAHFGIHEAIKQLLKAKS